MIDPLRRNVWLSLSALFTSVTTLVCCVLPAVLVSLGAGAAVVGLVTAFPQLIWLSEHKGLVFGMAAAMLAVSGLALREPGTCPVRPTLRSRQAANGCAAPVQGFSRARSSSWQ